MVLIEHDSYGRSIKEGFSDANDGTVDDELITNTYGTTGITKDKIVSSTAALLNGAGTINRFFYYDACGRLKRETRNSILELNNNTSCEIVYTYDAADNLLTVTINTPNGSQTLTVINTNEYDHAGRKNKEKIKINNYTETLLSQIDYTVKEQISALKLGPNASVPLQTVNFSYLHNRFLQKINDPASLGSDLFGMHLYYDGVFTGSGHPGKPQWKHQQCSMEVKPGSKPATLWLYL